MDYLDWSTLRPITIPLLVSGFNHSYSLPRPFHSQTGSGVAVALKTHVQLRFKSGWSSETSIMLPLIITAFFLFFSTACASPVYIAARQLELPVCLLTYDLQRNY